MKLVLDEQILARRPRERGRMLLTPFDPEVQIGFKRINEQACYFVACRDGVGQELIRELNLMNFDIMRQSLGPGSEPVG